MPTQEDVFAAADDIAASGQKVTLESVRAVTNGSFSTISPLLKAWRTQKATVAQPMREPAPDVVAERLTALGGEIWGLAMGLANDRLATERAALAQAQAEIEEEKAEAVGLADSLGSKVDELSSQAEQMRREMQQTHKAYVDAKNDADHMRVEVREAKGEGRWAGERLAEMKTERDQARQAEAVAVAELARVQGQADILREQVAQFSTMFGKAEPSEAPEISGDRAEAAG